MIKNIVFDMGNVLLRYDIRVFLQKVDESCRKLVEEEIFRSLDWVLLDKGTISVEEAKKNMKSRLPDNCKKWVDEILDNWHEEIPSYPDMEKLIKEISDEGYKIYLLSNVSKRYHIFRKKMKYLKYFDGEFISSDWNMLKPNPVIFETFLRHYNLVANESYFIDDSSQNIEGALSVGMHGFVYHGNIHKLRQDMIKNGIRITP